MFFRPSVPPQFIRMEQLGSNRTELPDILGSTETWSTVFSLL